jgi:hypothetical protein
LLVWNGPGLGRRSLHNEVAAGWAADALQLEKIKSSTWTQIEKNCQTVDGQGVMLPPKVQQAITQKYAEKCFLANNIDGWIEAAWPVKTKAEDANEWSYEAPKLRFCVSLGGDDTDDTQTEAVVANSNKDRDQFFKAVFSDEFWRRFELADRDPKLLIAAITGWLKFTDAFEFDERDCPPEIELVQRVFVGLFALVLPQICPYGDSQVEATFLKRPKSCEQTVCSWSPGGGSRPGSLDLESKNRV